MTATLNTLIVTGASGFLGQEIVAQALNSGLAVKAIVRQKQKLAENTWYQHPALDIIEADLATESSIQQLVQALTGLNLQHTCLIHTVSAMTGDDKTHAEHTITPLKHVLSAMQLIGLQRLVLFSSLSVYGYSVLFDGNQLDETSPTESYLNCRDAYCRAKLKQEHMAIQAAQQQGFIITVLRPGVIYGPNRYWSARLGIKKGAFALLIGSSALLPLIHVQECANATVLAAKSRVEHSDIQFGRLEIINVIGDDVCNQKDYLAQLKHNKRLSLKLAVTVPWKLVKTTAKFLFLITSVIPKLSAVIPTLLLEPALHARFKPLKYNNSRLKQRLAWQARENLSAYLKREH